MDAWYDGFVGFLERSNLSFSVRSGEHSAVVLVCDFLGFLSWGGSRREASR